MPPDKCPFPRPFPAGFDSCLAFTPQSYTAIDLHYRPSTAMTSCTHLVVGEVADRPGAYYPRCGLGTAAEREAWVQRVTADRLSGLRRLSAEYRKWSRTRMGPLWELKGRLLAARHRGDAAAARAIGHELEAGADDLLRSAEGFVDERREECEALGLSPEPLKELIRLAITDWAWSSVMTSGYQIPDALLARFPEPIRLFFTSTRTVSSPR
jgi:hypothetical protein